MNIHIMRTFVKLRHMVAAHTDLTRKIAALERRYDGQFQVVFAALRELMKPAQLKTRPVGFRRD